MSRLYVLCPKCRHRNDRLGGRRKCVQCNATLTKRRGPKHAGTLRKDSYPVYEAFSMEVHGGEPDSCRVCGRPRHEAMKHHRDHDHVTGKPRGVTCFQCNTLMPRLLTLERARAIVAYLERVDSYYRTQEAA
jgi:hypothetical protein